MKGCNLEPIIKWPGGKAKELVFITPNLPKFYKNFYDPFVGGGSVFMGLEANHYYINDLSSELISLYRAIAYSDDDFYKKAFLMNDSWQKAKDFHDVHFDELCDLYLRFRNGDVDETTLKKQVKAFCKRTLTESERIVLLASNQVSIYQEELNLNLNRKLLRMKNLEIQHGLMPINDISDNIETAIKSALYMFYRHLYNNSNDNSLKKCLFFFLRNYAYSGMFRYNDKGDFNVPYGGIAYNSKQLDKKLLYYQSNPVLTRFSNTTIENLDFESFLKKNNPQEDDFVFLDPPYDTEFSTYARNEFTRDDQVRLAHYLINQCHANWMLIIKNTDFIYNLYSNCKKLNIKTFNKEYVVSFMNRNDKKVTHLLITNYE